MIVVADDVVAFCLPLTLAIAVSAIAQPGDGDG